MEKDSGTSCKIPDTITSILSGLNRSLLIAIVLIPSVFASASS
jgi:hypothetical protein